jgi:hypothetical protein
MNSALPLTRLVPIIAHAVAVSFLMAVRTGRRIFGVCRARCIDYILNKQLRPAPVPFRVCMLVVLPRSLTQALLCESGKAVPEQNILFARSTGSPARSLSMCTWSSMK